MKGALDPLFAWADGLSAARAGRCGCLIVLIGAPVLWALVYLCAKVALRAFGGQ